MKRKWMGLMLTLTLGIAMGCAAGSTQEMSVDFYDMGKADAMLITLPDGYTMLIDTGTNKGGKALVERFEQEGIGPIDMMIITHYDKDHVGGADSIIEDTGVRSVMMPVYDKDSKQHDQFMEALDERPEIERLPLERAGRTEFERGGARISVTAAQRESYGVDEENDFSLCVRIAYGGIRFLFAGDAEAPRQRELLEEGDVQCDVLKVPYHGRMVDVSPQFAAAASPQIAFVPDDEEDPANPLLVKLYEDMGTAVYCGKDGGITVTTDGRTLSVREH